MPSLKEKLMVTGTTVVWSRWREPNRFQRFFRDKTGRPWGWSGDGGGPKRGVKDDSQTSGLSKQIEGPQLTERGKKSKCEMKKHLFSSGCV